MASLGRGWPVAGSMVSIAGRWGVKSRQWSVILRRAHFRMGRGDGRC